VVLNMPRYPEVFVRVADGAPLAKILERVDAEMRKAGISSVHRCAFKARVPRTYALAVDYIRQWCETD
jgi:hypothetical protein